MGDIKVSKNLIFLSFLEKDILVQKKSRHVGISLNSFNSKSFQDINMKIGTQEVQDIIYIFLFLKIDLRSHLMGDIKV